MMYLHWNLVDRLNFKQSTNRIIYLINLFTTEQSPHFSILNLVSPTFENIKKCFSFHFEYFSAHTYFRFCINSAQKLSKLNRKMKNLIFFSAETADNSKIKIEKWELWLITLWTTWFEMISVVCSHSRY